ncbi:MAG: peptidoglycan D,D-transpeptidase FtsI family protein [Anaerovoracaceae bacterium]
MGRKGNNLRQRQNGRLKLTAAVTTIVFAALICRLFYLQILSHDDLQAAAVSQYQVAVEGLDTRGQIFDRNLEPLTGGTEQYIYFLETDRLDGEAEALLASVSARQISVIPGANPRYTVYRSQIFDPIANQRLKEDYGAYALCTSARYSDSQTACHLLGYLNESEKKGVSGLEKACEQTLAAESRDLVLWADSSGGILSGISPKLVGGESLREGNLVTTLDGGLQRACETALADRDASGAVLVSELETGEILAWASSPVFNPNTVEAYLTDGGDCLVDKCIQGVYAPGSVFKVVVAAAALESGIVDPEAVYDCDGQDTVGGITLGCTMGPAGGHGPVNMKEAMARSCNCYFAVLGEKVGTERILDMARRLGLGSLVFSRFTEETAGNLPAAASLGEWDISNLSIGQGSLQVTPAQVHRMMSIVCGGGRTVKLKVVKGQGDGADAEDGGDQGAGGAKQILPASVAGILEEMLAAVMEEGTGRSSLRSVPAWGKTGTAETVRAGEAVSDCWFSGCCQVGETRFVITVLVEDGTSGSSSALPIFDAMADYLQVRQFQMK